MEIKTKFNIGDCVNCIYTEKGLNIVWAKIEEIIIGKENVFYRVCFKQLNSPCYCNIEQEHTFETKGQAYQYLKDNLEEFIY